MNYRHIYHAGNFGDVMKHAVLALVVEALKKKDAPFYALDTHAGIGTYDLASIEAGKTGEWREGIGRVLADAAPAVALAPYLAAVRAANSSQDVMPAKAGIQEANESVDSRLRGNDSKGESIRWYPGSARIIRTLMRRGDRLVACELHPADVQTLDEEFARDRQVKVHALDGWLALKSFLPPRERRGLVLVDPPYEEPGEFARLATGLREAHARWATGIYLLWYPVKDRTDSDALLATIVASGIRRVAVCELLLRPANDPERLSGSGLVIVNLPWGLDEGLRAMLPELARMLGSEGASWRVESLVGE